MIHETQIKAYILFCDHCKDRIFWVCEYDLDYTDEKNKLINELIEHNGIKIIDDKHYCNECYWMLFEKE